MVVLAVWVFPGEGTRLIAQLVKTDNLLKLVKITQVERRHVKPHKHFEKLHVKEIGAEADTPVGELDDAV